MQSILALLGSYVSSYISALESLISTFWYLPIIDGLFLGPLVLFFAICSFALSIFTSYVGGDS